jgi:hypothetical protein
VPKKRLSKSSLLWFIRSRSYVSIPDIRRRFNLDEGEEVAAVASAEGKVFVGLPADAARVLGELVREGRVGLELEPSLHAHAAIGVYVIPQHGHAYGAERPESYAPGPALEEPF